MSVIDSYATFFVLSYVKILSVTFELLVPVGQRLNQYPDVDESAKQNYVAIRNKILIFHTFF